MGDMANTEPDIRCVGIAGGGQLAQMMLPAAARLGLDVVVMDPDAACSASSGAREVIVGDFDSAEGLAALAAASDAVTFEIERIDAGVLARLQDEGHIVRPAAGVLAIIQDKLEQKRFLERLDVPTSPFVVHQPGRAAAMSLPCVWKSRRDGYDGRGVAMIEDEAQLAAVPDAPALLEARVDIDYELAILVCRDVYGTVAHYPLVDIIMDPDSHVMDRLVAPAAVPESIAARCRELSTVVAEALDYVGVLALEFFVDKQGLVLVNELSPRPHNSAHYTIEACPTSQFEQHLRAVSGKALGPTELLSPAVTFNILGAPGAQGQPVYVGFDEAAATDGVFIHCYDKPVVRPGRKMAHATVMAETREKAIELADRLTAQLRVEGRNE